jgi:predicted DNA-binding protein (MmcQ/YjbR family)
MSRPTAGSPRDQVIEVCLAKPGSAEDYPFGDEVAVFKVGGKMFALVPLAESRASVSPRCDPGLAADLRQKYPAVTPGHHPSKRHWNTVTLDGSVPEEELLDLIDHSYQLVVASLPRAERATLDS